MPIYLTAPAKDGLSRIFDRQIWTSDGVAVGPRIEGTQPVLLPPYFCVMHPTNWQPSRLWAWTCLWLPHPESHCLWVAAPASWDYNTNGSKARTYMALTEQRYTERASTQVIAR